MKYVCQKLRERDQTLFSEWGHKCHRKRGTNTIKQLSGNANRNWELSQLGLDLFLTAPRENTSGENQLPIGIRSTRKMIFFSQCELEEDYQMLGYEFDECRLQPGSDIDELDVSRMRKQDEVEYFELLPCELRTQVKLDNFDKFEESLVIYQMVLGAIA